MNITLISSVRAMRGPLLGAVACALIGCAGSESAPEEHFYRMPVEAVPQALARPDGSSPLPGVLTVHRFLADSLLSNRSVVFSESALPHSVKPYHYHAWIDPPPRMLQELTVSSLRRAAVATDVVTPEYDIQADYVLMGKLLRLEHVRGHPAKVKVAVEFALTRPYDQRFGWVREFSAEETVSDETIASATRAMGVAWGEILAQLVRVIRQSNRSS